MTSTWLAPLRRLDRQALARRFARGQPVDPASLADTRFRGVTLGLPALIERLAWSLFAKDVIRDDDGALVGWNVRLQQPAQRDPTTLATTTLRPRITRRTPQLFAPFVVAGTPDGGNARDGGGLDYRPTHRWSPLAAVIDPLVVLNRDDDDDDDVPVLLGVSRVAVGGRHITTPTWFALRADGPVPAADRAAGRALVRARPPHR
jgi:hypothetical protein